MWAMSTPRRRTTIAALVLAFGLWPACDNAGDEPDTGAPPPRASSGAPGANAGGAVDGGNPAGGSSVGGSVNGGASAGRRSNGGAATGGAPLSGSGAASGVGGGAIGGVSGATSAGGAEPDGGASDGGARADNGGAQTGEAGAAGANVPGSDPFGVRELYPSALPSSVWTSEHWSGAAYALDARRDPNDPAGLSGMRGEGSLQVTGTGELVMSGSQPRIYVYPAAARPWRNLEVTVYYRRVADDGTAYAGLVVGVRSGADGHTGATACEAHTYYARLRHDGAIDFEKELEHPASSTRARVSPENAWPPDGELPSERWIGWKLVVYDLPAGEGVKLEAYRDLAEGAGGGDWQLVNETTDAGGWTVDTDCSQYAPVDGKSDHIVLEDGVTFIRNTRIDEARYRWFSVREIDVKAGVP